MRGRQMAKTILNDVEVLDQEVAVQGTSGQQRAHRCKSVVLNLPSLGLRAALALAGLPDPTVLRRISSASRLHRLANPRPLGG
jgi:hypothetical protein